MKNEVCRQAHNRYIKGSCLKVGLHRCYDLGKEASELTRDVV